MTHIKNYYFIILIVLIVNIPSLHANNFLQRWNDGLNGSRLTAYSGSAISSNSTLSIINFCSNGRYTYQRDSSWYVEGQASGIGKNLIKGRWEIIQQGVQFYLRYVTDAGDKGQFPIYLQNNGKVNIGGVGYSLEKWKATNC